MKIDDKPTEIIKSWKLLNKCTAGYIMFTSLI